MASEAFENPGMRRVIRDSEAAELARNQLASDHAQVLRARRLSREASRRISEHTVMTPEKMRIRERIIEMMIDEADRAYPDLDLNKMNGHVVMHEDAAPARPIRQKFQRFFTQMHVGPVWVIQSRDVGDENIPSPGWRDDPGAFTEIDNFLGTAMTPKGKLFSFYAETVRDVEDIDLQIALDRCNYDSPIDLAPYEIPDELHEGEMPLAVQYWIEDLNALKRN